MRRRVDQELMLDRFRKEIHELTPEERNFLVLLDMKLTSLEKDLKCEIKEMLGFGEQRAHDGATGLCRDCVEVEWAIDFFIGEDDLAWDDEQDNILAHLSETCGTDEDWKFGIADGENHNEFQHSPAHPMKDEIHCWLYHGLYHHASLDLPDGRCHVGLDWGNILRIDSIGVDLKLIFQSSMDI